MMLDRSDTASRNDLHLKKGYGLLRGLLQLPAGGTGAADVQLDALPAGDPAAELAGVQLLRRLAAHGTHASGFHDTRSDGKDK